MVADMRSRRSLFVVGLTHRSSKESKAVMLIGDMGIARLMIRVQQKGPALSSASAPAPRNKYFLDLLVVDGFCGESRYSPTRLLPVAAPRKLVSSLRSPASASFLL
ncbi:hypothetical protein MTR67_000794 [Solanum verrucosum]|uniref:Uncharacterized protein n=1 Tax=Solanum verrucosum TaxID=315347 RepID=A0AAF0PM08_SOLVR|nr:hypothetical protein MTR67_000794 [Solanum verrucosum]